MSGRPWYEPKQCQVPEHWRGQHSPDCWTPEQREDGADGVFYSEQGASV